MPLSYRSDIDGLRAFAVISVILFHLGVPSISGGFVGVDIFFVISGFLITSILQKDISNQTFSLMNFWERRVRRIAPALFLVAISCLFVGWFVLLPEDYKRLAQQEFALTTFSSNILFYLQSGYFDTANETKPLLHTWSLAVEEQFYFVFPLTLFLIHKFFPAHLVKILIGIFVFSLALSIYGVKKYPVATFYFLPTRAWELLFGSLLVYARPSSIDHKYLPRLLGFSGVALILVPIFLYSRDTAFPGLAAFVPCCGAAMLIWSGKTKTSLPHRILASAPFVFIGKISYSWYLWHWPAIVFYKYYYSGPLELRDMIMILLVTFCMSVASWKFVETPFRKTSIPISLIFYTSSSLLILIAAFSLFLVSQKGYKQRFEQNVLTYAEAENDKNPYQSQCNRPSLERIRKDKICVTNEKSDIHPSFLLWGDSHADAIAPAFYALSRKNNISGYISTYDGCPPVLNIDQKGRGATFYCKDFNDEMVKFIERQKIQKVYLVASWGNWMYNPKLYSSAHTRNYNLHFDQGINQDVVQQFSNTIDLLVSKKIHVYVFQTFPTAKFDPPRELALQEAFYKNKPNNISIKISLYSKQRLPIEILSRKYKANPFVVFLDPIKYLCNINECRVSAEGKSLYYNGGHLSTYGATYLSPMIDGSLTREIK